MEIDTDTQKRVNDLLIKSKKYEEAMLALKDPHVAYLAALECWTDLRVQITKELAPFAGTSPITVPVEAGQVTLSKCPDKYHNGQYGTTQLRDQIAKMKQDAERLLAVKEEPKISPEECAIALLINEKAGMALREAKKKEKKEPEYVFAANYATPTSPMKPIDARIIVEVPRATSIPGIYYYGYSTIKKLEGRLVKFRYRKLFDAKTDKNVKIRDGKDHEEVVGWVEKDWGVWQTNEGHYCLRLRNYNRIVDTDMGMTVEEAERLHKLGQLAHGEYAFRTYRLEGVVPGTFENLYGSDWKIVDGAD